MDTQLTADAPGRATPLQPTDQETEKRGIRIGKIFGIEVRVDWSVAIVVVFLAWGLATVSLPAAAEHYRRSEYWIAALATTAMFLASILAHEVSHSIVATRLGIKVRDITLNVFGGVSSLESEARTPRGDFAIAFAGPATSIVIGVVGIAIAIALNLAGVSRLAVASLMWLGGINLLLAVFNLVPAAPLDGGRVLRAWLWHRNGDHDRAAIKATRVGQAFGWLLVGLGVLEFIAGGDIGGLWLVFIGWFLLGAARAEEMQVRMQHSLQGVRARDVMTPSPVTAPADMSIARILDEYVLRHHCSAFPLVDDQGRVVGLLTLADCKSVPPAERATTLAREVATSLARVPIALPDEPLVAVLQRAHGGRVLVMRDGALEGIITPSDITRAVQARISAA